MRPHKMCGIPEPHSAHEFIVNAGSVDFQQIYGCPGVPQLFASPVPEPGPCWHDSGITWPGQSNSVRCELRAGHAGAHEADRGSRGGVAVWTDEEVSP